MNIIHICSLLTERRAHCKVPLTVKAPNGSASTCTLGNAPLNGRMAERAQGLRGAEGVEGLLGVEETGALGRDLMRGGQYTRQVRGPEVGGANSPMSAECSVSNSHV